MSTTVMSDAMVMPATESPPLATKLIDQTVAAAAAEVEFVKCDCCGLTEECTPGYIERIRERYGGKWICGLCGEAVKDEIVRNERLISTQEAMARHVAFCRTPSVSDGASPDPAVHLIAAVRQILRRSLDSPSCVRSVPCSPTTRSVDSGGGGLTRSESCISSLALGGDSSSSYRESGNDGDRKSRKNQSPR